MDEFRKKSKKANLERRRNTLLLLGLVIALGITLFALEYETAPKKVIDLGDLAQVEVEEEVIPITREQQVQPPPPPPPPRVVEVLNIVDDDMEIEDELEIEDSEADENTVIDLNPVIIAETAEEEVEEEVFFFGILEENPEFPGGVAALTPWLTKQIKYPTIAQENGIQGKVFYTFVVDTDGSVTNIRITRGVDPAIDKEAMRVLQLIPKWKPGKQRGKPVKVAFSGSINFVLQ